MRFLSILAVSLTIFLTLLFLNRVSITEELLAKGIQRLGGQDIQLTVGRLTSSELTIASFAAAFPQDSAIEKIQLQNLTLRFSMGELLKKQLSGLTIERARIGLGKKKRKTESTSSYQTIQELLEQQPRPPFLPATIVIQELLLSGPGAGSLAGKPAHISCQLSDSSLSLTLSLAKEAIRIVATLQRQEKQRVRLQLNAHQAGTHFFHLSLLHQQNAITGKLTALLDTVTILSPLLPLSLPPVSGELDLDFIARNSEETALTLELAIQGQGLSLPGWDLASLSGKLALQTDNFKTVSFQQGSQIAMEKIVGSAAELDGLHFQFTGNLQRMKDLVELSFAHGSRLTVKGLKAKTLQLEEAEVVPALTFTHSPQETRLRLHPEFTAAVRELQAGKLSIARLDLSPETEIILPLPPDLTKASNAGSGKIMLDLQELRFQDLLVQPGLLHLEIPAPADTGGPSPLQLLLNSSELTVQWKEMRIPLQDIEAGLTVNDQDLHLTIALSHTMIPGRIEGRADHNRKNGTGKAHFSTVQAFDLQAEQTDLSQLVNGLELPFTLSSGLLDCSATMQWEKGVPDFINSGFALRDGIGEYKNIRLSGLNIQQNFQLLPRIRTLNPGHILISELDSGLKVEDIAVSNQLIPPAGDGLPTLLLDSIAGTLLGGRISSNDIEVNPSRLEMDFVVQLSGLVLEEIMKLIKVAGLSVTGLIDGNIPVQIRDRQVRVADGKLHSRAPGGIINYLPPGGRAAISYLPEYVMQALEEFHYDTLSAIPLYEPDGNLSLNFHIEGKSPRLDSSRPVHLNLNTEQNLLSLLKSLRYTKGLTKDLENQIETKSQKE